MKYRLLTLTALAVSFVTSVQADQTINITGATAFRSAAAASIDAAFNAAGASTWAKYFANTNDDGSSANGGNSSYMAWRGTFPGLSGITTIRATWNGSVEGVRALVVPNVTNNAKYIPQATIDGVALGTQNASASFATVDAAAVQAVADLAFSDVTTSSTPVGGATLGGPVGAIVFTMVANKTWRDDIGGDTAGVTSISAQQFRQLLSAGKAKLSLFTGNLAHTNLVYATGRNDGSGTRTVYLAETGYGIANPVNQYVGYDRTDTNTLPSIVYTAAGGGFAPLPGGAPTPTIKSTVWGQDQDGNGGYFSGAEIRADMAKTTAACTVYTWFDGDFSGDYDASEATVLASASKLYLLSWLSIADAKTAAGTAPGNKAYILGYNGTRLDQFANDINTLGSSGLASLDKAKVTNGQYAAWGFENLFYLSGNANSPIVFNELKTRLNSDTVIGTAGIRLGAMNVTRTVDGGNIIPN